MLKNDQNPDHAVYSYIPMEGKFIPSYNLESWSQNCQDLFAYLLCGNSGKFLDIGCRKIYSSNTYKLEKLGWSGVCVDIDEEAVEFTQRERNVVAHHVDVTTIKFKEILQQHEKHYNYISLDVDGVEPTLKALDSLFEVGITFDCMTLETDPTSYKQEIRIPSLEIIAQQGYTVLHENVMIYWPNGIWKINDGINPVEDWWIRTEAFDKNLLSTKSYAKMDTEIIDELLQWELSSKPWMQIINKGKINGDITLQAWRDMKF